MGYAIIDYFYYSVGGDGYEFKSKDSFLEDLNASLSRSSDGGRKGRAFIRGSGGSLWDYRGEVHGKVLGDEIRKSNDRYLGRMRTNISGAATLDGVADLERSVDRSYEDSTIGEIDVLLSEQADVLSRAIAIGAEGVGREVGGVAPGSEQLRRLDLKIDDVDRQLRRLPVNNLNAPARNRLVRVKADLEEKRRLMSGGWRDYDRF